jgi:sulfur carrier protein
LFRITVNGEPVETQAANLAALCEELGYGGTRIATARNGEFVAAAERALTALDEGDEIEIVAARQGG